MTSGNYDEDPNVTADLDALDEDGNAQDLIVEQLNAGVDNTSYGLLTYAVRALNDVGLDEFVSRVAGEDGVQIAEEQLDTSVSSTDVAFLTYASRALDDVGQDELRSLLFATDEDGGDVSVVADAVNDGIANSTVGLVTYMVRALNDVGLDELVTRNTDSTGTQIDPKAYGANATHSSVSLGTSDTQLLSATTDRRNFTIVNNGGDIVFIEMGGDAADTTDGLPIESGQEYTDQEFTGEVRGIANSGTQDIRVVEVTA